jgi:hypothetical protein
MMCNAFVFAIYRTRINAGGPAIGGMSAPSGYVET